jgi:hypothetical protein
MTTKTAALESLEKMLERGGWRINAIDLDLHHSTARVEVARIDGLQVTLDARNGRASITREMLKPEAPKTQRNRYSSGLTTQFLGRTCAEGPRHGLKILCDYIADNATTPLLPFEVRRVMALCLNQS